MADPSHLEDLAALGASWYFVWDWCDAPDCIPMTRDMSLPKVCPPILLVGNEPNAMEPNGAPVSPVDAAAKAKAIQAKCPQTKLVVGNVSADDWSVVGGWGNGYNWLKEFLNSYPDYGGALGAHCYTRHSASWCIGQLAAIRKLYKGDIWITEFAVLDMDRLQFGRLLNYITRNFLRYSVYTNRQPPSAFDQGWGIPGIDLVKPDGTLTDVGEIYYRK